MYISSEYWVDKLVDGKPSGYLNYHSQRTIGVVRSQVEAVLAEVRDEDGVSAKDQLEWVSTTPNYSEAPCPKGELFAALRRGSNEGYLAEIYALDRHEGVARGIVTIKFLTNKAFVYRVVEALNEACDEGCYAHDSPPL